VLLVVLAIFENTVQHANAAELYLQGIGYREQELQVAKGQRF
jgi:hypothetical protein